MGQARLSAAKKVVYAAYTPLARNLPR